MTSITETGHTKNAANFEPLFIALSVFLIAPRLF